MIVAQFVKRSTSRFGRIAYVAPLILLAGPWAAGCKSPKRPVPLDPISKVNAIGLINANVDRVSGTLRASGWVDGTFVDQDGRQRAYNVDGTLLYLAPGYVRFDLKSFGKRRFLFGANARRYWFYNSQDDSYLCGWHDDDEAEVDMPLQPRQLIEALALWPIVISDGNGAAPSECTHLIQRVLPDRQQILCLVQNEIGELLLEKEYWLDRYPPRLIRRVVFRDADGVVVLQSRLDDYRRLRPGGPWLPHLLSANWPKSNARMRFRIGRWSTVDQVKPDGPQFATPAQCEP